MKAPVEPSPPPAVRRLLALTALLSLGLAGTPTLAQRSAGDPQQMLQQRVELYTTKLAR